MSVTAVVEGALVPPIGCAAVICGSKYLPSLPGNTLRWSARISASAFLIRASVAASCANEAAGAATPASASDANAARVKFMPI